MSTCKGRIAIVSSPGKIERSADGWIWNYIHRYEVGANGPAVQHAKLWMFHRAAPLDGGTESLELVVSSANLTRDGLRRQIQAGWRCVLPLEARDSGNPKRNDSWGILPQFLTELGLATGDNGSRFIGQWIDLLRRCSCPVDVKFIASVPGTHSANTPPRWGVSGLSDCWPKTGKRRVSVMVPTVGRWDTKTIGEWSKTAGLAPKGLELAWIRKSHPWAHHWILDEETATALRECDIRWRVISHPSGNDWKSPLCLQHQQADPRWSHAKLYKLVAGRWRRILVTSANFSRAAWGDPLPGNRLKIDNFELGVYFPDRESFPDNTPPCEFEPATCPVDQQRRPEENIAWLAAGWDGKLLTIECRTLPEADLEPCVALTVAGSKELQTRRVKWSGHIPRSAKMVWRYADKVPLFLQVKTKGGDERHVAVNDSRPYSGDQFPGEAYDEFDAEERSKELDRLLEERYWRLQHFDSGDVPRTVRTAGAAGGAASDYSVPAYMDARRRFRLIDNWWAELNKSDELLKPSVRNDGERILKRWKKVAASAEHEQGIRIAAKVAAGELEVRLRRNS